MYHHRKLTAESYCWLIGYAGTDKDGAGFLVHRQQGWRAELAASTSWKEFLARCTRRFNASGIHTLNLDRLVKLYNPQPVETMTELIGAAAGLLINPRAYGHEPVLDAAVQRDLLLLNTIHNAPGAIFVPWNHAQRYDAIGGPHTAAPQVPDELFLAYAEEFMAVARENADIDSVIAMRRCADRLGPQPLALLMDGKRMPARRRTRITKNTPALEVSL